MELTSRELFARLLRCEAEGEGPDGMRAVATVTMNRVRVQKGEYARVCQGDLRKVITQQCQYSCYKTSIAGAPNNQNVWNLGVESGDVFYQIADEAIGGAIFPAVGGNCLWYMNPFSPTCPDPFPHNGVGKFYIRIGRHCFYTPTSDYDKT